MKLPLSILIITKNEEEVIEYCLRSAGQIAKEIIIVDSYSTDKTVAIASKFTKKISFGTFSNFKEKREQALANAKEEWILFLDADERISPDLAEEITEKITKGAYDGYYIPFKHHFLGKWLKHGGWYPSYLPRLAKREKASIRNPIHELLFIDGNVGYLKNDIIHLGDTSLFKRIDKTNKYTSMQAESEYKTRKEHMFIIVLKMCSVPILRFIKIYFVKQGFLDGVHGFIRAYLYMYTCFLVYMKEIELHVKIGKISKSMSKV